MIPTPDYNKMDSNICTHLKPLENDLIAKAIPITFRGQAWSRNCHEWVYFNCYLDRKSIEIKYNFPDFIVYHEHLGTHDGQEAGFICTKCQDGIMGHHIRNSKGRIIYKP